MKDKKFVLDRAKLQLKFGILPWILKILGFMLFILGCRYIKGSDNAGLASPAFFVAGMIFILVPIFISLILKHWIRVLFFIFLFIPNTILITYVLRKIPENILEWILVLCWVILYLYLRLAKNIRIGKISF